MRNANSQQGTEASSVKTVGGKLGFKAVAILVGTSEQSEDCSYDLPGFIYCRYLVRVPFRAGQKLGRRVELRIASQW
jgi:hypothetical protein